MIGIYNNEFLDYLKKNLGPIKTTGKSIVCRCPNCEYNKNRKHYHLYINLHIPYFHCFYAGCGFSGHISKLLTKVEGKDLSNEFVSKEAIEEFSKKKTDFEKFIPKVKEVYLPEITDQFRAKIEYLKNRLKYQHPDVTKIDGLVLDSEKFIYLNNIKTDDKLNGIRKLLYTNFIGFLTENKTTLIMRNVVDSYSFKHYKLKFQEVKYIDYYKIKGGNITSNNVILAEGIFDIITEHIFDKTNLKKDACLYAAALSSNYESLLKSISFHEQLFKMNVFILSDSDVNIYYYKKLKKLNSHIIDKLVIYYNKTGKDFNVSPLTIEKFVI